MEYVMWLTENRLRVIFIFKDKIIEAFQSFTFPKFLLIIALTMPMS